MREIDPVIYEMTVKENAALKIENMKVFKDLSRLLARFEELQDENRKLVEEKMVKPTSDEGALR